MTTRSLPPLSLYIHIPWCVRKCPYCDFNSHAAGKTLPEEAYVDALLEDFHADLAFVQGRAIQTIFFGGGTPSLFQAKSFDRLLTAISKQVSFAHDIEITMEANPGTVEAERFCDYRNAGINRLSIGVQSFHPEKLLVLGRIHDGDAAKSAIITAEKSGFSNVNVDLMYGLPNQSVADAIEDLQTALTFQPRHLSWYQLTIEPNTVFYKHPPKTPNDDLIIEMEHEGRALLQDHQLHRYEISAYSQTGFEAKHNLNYWLFGDYLGIGAGAHGKITTADGSIIRTQKMRQPNDYLNAEKPFLSQKTIVAPEQLPFEFILNTTRLMRTIPLSLYDAHTWQDSATLLSTLKNAENQGLITLTPSTFTVTRKGQEFLNDLQELFLLDSD